MKRKPNRSRRQFEVLEDRQMMATGLGLSGPLYEPTTIQQPAYVSTIDATFSGVSSKTLVDTSTWVMGRTPNHNETLVRDRKTSRKKRA
jgi:hypothetical protein